MQVRLPGVEGDAHGDVFFMALLDYYALAVSIRATRLRCASVLAKRTDRRWHHPQIQLQFTLQPAGERRAR